MERDEPRLRWRLRKKKQKPKTVGAELNDIVNDMRKNMKPYMDTEGAKPDIKGT